MRWLARLQMRIEMLFGRGTARSRLDEELRDHLERQIEENIAVGMSAEEARFAALREFGNAALVREQAHATWSWNWLEALLRDVRYGVRALGRTPGFATIAILVMALGIGINTAIFSVVHHILVEPLPFPQPEQLYAIWARSDAQGQSRVAASGPDFLDYHDQNKSFSALAVVLPDFTFTWTGEGDPKLVNCTAVSEDFFRMLGIRPYMGRLYEPREFTYLENDTILISYRFWRNQLGSDPHVLGRVIHFEEDAQTIVGVLPPMPDLYPDTDVYPKLTSHPSWDYMKWRGNKFLTVMGRLKPGATPATAAGELTAILRRAPGEPGDVRVQLVPLKDDLVGGSKTQLRVIMAATALVLLIACINVAALLLARATRRGAEIALRVSLGAGQRRLAQQFTAEGLVLAASGCVFGVLAGWFGLRLIGRLPGLQLPRMEGIHLNGLVLLVTAAVAIATTLLFGWAPLLGFSRTNLSPALRSGRTETGRSHRRTFAWLVIAEIATSVILSVCTGLLLRSFWRVEHVDPGFQPESMFTTYLRTNFYTKEGRPFWRDVLAGISALPGVRAAALADCTPGSGAATATLVFSDRANVPDHAPPTQGCWISGDFFKTSETPLLSGRFFSGSDDADSPPVVIVNAEAARQYWPGENPIGERIGVNYTGAGRVSKGAPRMRQVVGVVGAIKQGPQDSATKPAIYMPYLQDETSHDMATMSLFVRSSANPAALADSVRARIHAVRPDQPVQDLQPMTVLMANSLAPRRYSLSLLGAFAALALLLSALGIYGVVSYTTQQQTREFGVRIALGATRGSVMSHVFRQGLALTASGAVIGAGGALWATQTLSHILFQVRPLDPVSFACAISVLAVISSCACLLPAWRASRLDPIQALRTE
ncbi:MAG: ADOP family duplicated permease [Terracidiphilus sp.]